MQQHPPLTGQLPPLRTTFSVPMKNVISVLAFRCWENFFDGTLGHSTLGGDKLGCGTWECTP